MSQHDAWLDSLLGLPSQEALERLSALGIAGVGIQLTQAPKSPQPDGQERVVAVRDGGKTLLVSRFLVGAPKKA